MQSSAGLGKIAETTAESAPATSVPAPHVVLRPPNQKRSTAAHFRLATVFCEVVADLLTITLAVALGYFIYDSLRLGKHLYYPITTVIFLAFMFAVSMVLMLDRVGAYRRGNSLLRVRETEQILRVSAQTFLIALAVSFFISILFSRWLLVLCLGLVPLLLFAQKSLTYLLLRSLHARGYGNESVLIYGSGLTGRRVFSVLQRSPKLGLEPLAFVDDDPAKAGSIIYEMGYERRRSAPVVKGPVTRELVAQYGADLVLIAIPSIGRERFAQTLQEAFSADARVSFVPSHLLATDPWVDYQDIDGVLLASFGRHTRRIGYESVKRACDVVGSLVLMLIGLPVFLLLALAIKIDSRGSVLFQQERVGQDGKLFKMFKFRTMHASSPSYEYSPRASSDPRITRLGKFLRQSSLDEVPQLLNVLKGEMSLVGPRPEMPFIVEQYTERHRQRLQVRPGLTGLWQLSGDRAFLIHENVEYDLYYIQHRSFFMDVAILLHTIIFAARGI
jgi:exopolysaccharide biosynthesis polyprenyl glycosylphosphotransferase